MTHFEIIRRVRQYVTENFLYMRPDFVFGDSDSLLESGIIDSMGVIELITFVQDEFGISVDDSEITEENLGSLASIARFTHTKLAEKVPA